MRAAISHRHWLIFLGIIISLLTLISISGDASATNVATDIDFDEVWISSRNPWVIMENVTVKHGVTLTIMPGVNISFDGNYSIHCGGTGRIIAEGLSDDQITVISGIPSQFNYMTVDSGRWGVFRNCTFSYGTIGLTTFDGTVVDNCTFLESVLGIRVQEASVTINGCEFKSFGKGVEVNKAYSYWVVNSNFVHGNIGISVDEDSRGTLVENCAFLYIQDVCIDYWATDGSNRIYNCTIKWSKRGIIFHRARSVSVVGTIFEQCAYGVSIRQSMGSTSNPIEIQRCRFLDCGNGVTIFRSMNISVHESSFIRNGEGFFQREYMAGIKVWKNNFLWNQKNVDKNTLISFEWSVDGVGNYWSDYTGTDADSDGIGDTPMVVTALDRDNHPLMLPVDFEDPIADPGDNIITSQHAPFKLDGGGSYDDTWIDNWTWTIKLPGRELVLEGEEVQAVIDIAGTFSVELRVTDAIGRTSKAFSTVLVKDTDAPAIFDIELPSETTTGDDFHIRCNVSDNVNVTGVWIFKRYGGGRTTRIDMVAMGEDVYGLNVSTPINSVKPLGIKFFATDLEGNTNSTQYYSIVVRDETSPVIIPPTFLNATTGEVLVVNCTVADNIALEYVRMEYRFLGSPLVTIDLEAGEVNWSAAIPVPPSATLMMDVRFLASDEFGNLANTSSIEVEVLDNDPPTIDSHATTPPLTELHKGDELIITATVEDNIAIEEVVLEVRYHETSWTPIALDGTDGSITGVVMVSKTLGNRFWYRLRVSDSSGNVREFESEEAVLQSMDPVILTQFPPDAFEGKLYSISLEAEDADTNTFELVWSVETNASWLVFDSASRNISGTPSIWEVGLYWVNVSVNDGEGGTAWTRFDLTVHDFDYPPGLEVISPTEGQEMEMPFKVSGRTSDDGDNVVWVKLRIDGGDWMTAEGTSPWSYKIGEGIAGPGGHLLEVVAFDGVSESEMVQVDFSIEESRVDDEGNNMVLWASILVASIVTILVLILISQRHR